MHHRKKGRMHHFLQAHPVVLGPTYVDRASVPDMMPHTILLLLRGQFTTLVG